MAVIFRVSSLCLCLCLLLGLACGQPEDPLDEIRQLHRRGRFAQTVDPLRKLVDEDPSRPETNLLLGLALLRTGESGMSIWSLRKAAESPEYAVEAGLLLTQAMLQSRTAPDAAVAIERVLELEPDNVNALVLRAQAYVAVSRLDEALADIDRVLELDPDNLAVLVPRVTTLIALARIEEAEAALATARERLETTEEDVEPRMRARLCVARGLFSLEKGEQEAAEALYSECLERFPTDQLVVTESVAFYQRIGEPERATEILREGLEKYPSAIFRALLARRMGALGETQEEERLLRDEAAERPSAASWFALADFYVQREEFDEAIEAFEAALAASRDPSPMLRFAYADTLVQAGRLEKARAVGEELEQPALRHLIRGRVLLGEGDARGALAAFEAGVRLWPNNAGARYLAGQAAERMGDFDRAVSDYRESLRANAAQTTAGLELARLYSAHGDHDEALAAIQRHMQSHQGDPEGYRVAIHVAHRAGRHGIAAEGLERLAKIPGQAVAAIVEEAELLALGRGPAMALEAVESAGLDLTDPANAPALEMAIAQLLELARYERAEALVAEALAAHPEEAHFHALGGRVGRAAGGPPEEARAEFETALELDPGWAPALAGLAELSAEAGERDAAIALYDRAAAADPASPAYELAAARLLLDAGETAEAAKRLERLLDHHPREASAASELAQVLAERGELERALDFAKRAAWLRDPAAEATLARIQELRAGPAQAERE